MNAQPNGFLPAHPKAANSYETLRKVNVSDRIEKKNGMSYLSWPFAVDQLLQLDPDARWEYPEFKAYGETLMTFCSVTAFGRTRTAQLPVMDHRNKPIPNPDAFQVNTAMQRCLVKAIALHGLGLYIYAGEDLPGVDHETGEIKGLDPRGDLGKNTAPTLVAAAVEKVRAIFKKDLDEDGECLALFDLHQEFVKDHDLYVALGDKLKDLEIISKDGWKKAVARGKELAEKQF